MYHPPRGGVRGGRDQFNWEDVKVDKHRENYLGHSLHAPVGRWQQGKDLTWYAKDGKTDDAHRKEINAIKEAEADVMAELLGGGKRRVVTGNVTQQELTNVLKRQQEDEEGDDLKETIQEVTKGFSSSGRLSISEIVPDDTKLIPERTLLQEDKNILITNRDDKNINVQTSTFQSEDRKKAKKIKKEKKKKKHKKDKHRTSKEIHSKRSKNDLSISSQDEDASNEPIRGRSRYRKTDDAGKSRPYSYSNSPKHDNGRVILRNRFHSTSRSNSPKKDAIRHRSRSKSPNRRHRYRYRSRSRSHSRSRSRSRSRSVSSRKPKVIRHRQSRSPSDYHNRSSQRYRNNDDRHKYNEFKRYSYNKGNDRMDRNYDRRPRN